MFPQTQKGYPPLGAKSAPSDGNPFIPASCLNYVLVNRRSRPLLYIETYLLFLPIIKMSFPSMLLFFLLPSGLTTSDFCPKVHHPQSYTYARKNISGKISGKFARYICALHKKKVKKALKYALFLPLYIVQHLVERHPLYGRLWLRMYVDL